MKHTRFVLATTLLIMVFAIGIASAAPLGEPSASFNASPTEGAYPLAVTFTGQAINMTEPFSYHWDFGDSSGAEKTSVTTISPITHTYLHPGKYTVTLAVYDIGFPVTTWVSTTKTEYITVTHVKPVVDFYWTTEPPGPLAAGKVIQFFDTITGEGITDTTWNFGDGTGNIAPIEHNIKHTYAAAGVYHVNLTATNDGGSTSTVKDITILPPVPQADFSSSATSGPVPLAVQFTDQSEGVGITTHSWVFGDGATSTVKNPLHAYGTIGVYSVSLYVTSPSGGDTKLKENYINVTNVTGPIVCPTPAPTPVPTQCPTPSVAGDKTGVYRPGVGFYLKTDMGNTWNPVTDIFLPWDNAQGDRPVSGDWNGDGVKETGVYRPGSGFYLKMDQGASWNPLTDKFLAWDNAPGDLPISGNWNTGTITTETGVYRPGSGLYLKMDDSGTWNPSTDQTLAWDNAAGDLPVTH